MLDADAGPTRTSGSLKGAGQQWRAPTRPMRLLYHEIAQSRDRDHQRLDVAGRARIGESGRTGETRELADERAPRCLTISLAT